jgi:carboxyl-terminal processing protease
MKMPRLGQMLIGILAFCFLYSCKKEESLATPLAPVTPPVATTPSTNKINDSALLYSRDLYLWYKQVPANFSIASYSDPNAIMEALRQFSIEPGFTGAVDKWSFAMKKDEWDGISSGTATADFGMQVGYYQSEDNLRVKYVEPSSPAGRAGVRRGWKITRINGSSSISYTNKDVVSNAVYNSSRTSFTFQKPDNNSVTISLQANGYQEDPIILDTVYTTGARKIGYLAFNSFMGDTNSVYREFATVFNKFAQQNINDLVVDLRYNGGGYVSVQEKLANYLVKASANGDVMMKQQYNDKLSEYNATTRFSKLGNLNLNRLFFIVTNGTASASELLINNLKPYMDVKLIGPTNTHGKPVGFFPYPVGDWYIFPVSFRTVNKTGEGNYFNGMPANSTASDGIDKDWGDVTEPCLASALRFISSGTYRLSTEGTYQDNATIRQANEVFDQHIFKGTIDTRRMNR